MLALSTLFVGGAIGGSIATYDSISTKTAYAEETGAVDLKDAFSVADLGFGYATDQSYTRTRVSIKSNTKFFETANDIWLGNCYDVGGYDFMEYFYINGKSARTIQKENADVALTKYPGFYPENETIASWAPIAIVMKADGQTIGFSIDRRYIPAGSLEITIKAGWTTEANGVKYTLSEDVKFISTVKEMSSTGGTANLVMKNAKEVAEESVTIKNNNASRWSDEGNEYIFMLEIQNGLFPASYGDGKWLADHIMYM